MLPEIVWNMPSIGTFNLHASLLPQYRGAAPINWAIINGEKETGVTTFFLTHEIDTGAIIHQKRVPIAEADDAGTVHDRLMELGGSLVIETVEDILRDDVHPVPQEQLTADVQLRPAPKIFKETCRIDWNKPMDDIYNFVRGLSPYPAAWTEMEDEQGTRRVLKIFATEKVVEEHQYEPGTVVTDGRTYFYVAVQGGYLSLTILQIAGKKRMPVSDFLRGFRVENALKLC
jgi:methionyl-tRNA formyltransferase